jgi:hypothetical protein
MVANCTIPKWRVANSEAHEGRKGSDCPANRNDEVIGGYRARCSADVMNEGERVTLGVRVCPRPSGRAPAQTWQTKRNRPHSVRDSVETLKAAPDSYLDFLLMTYTNDFD